MNREVKVREDRFQNLDDEIRANHRNDPEQAERIIKLGRSMVRAIRRSCFVRRSNE